MLMTTTLELPRSLRFTIGSEPRPFIVPQPAIATPRLDAIAARQHAARVIDVLFVGGLFALATTFLLGIAGC